jgi:hypothetical protein
LVEFLKPALLRTLLGATIGACALSGYLLRGAGASAKRAPVVAPSSAEELDELKSRIAGLEQTVASNGTPHYIFEPRVETERPDGRGEPDSSPSDLADQGHVGPPKVSSEELRDLDMRRRQRFSNLLGSEARDRSWAPGYETSLRDAVQAAAQGEGAPVVESVTCRTSICRLEVSSSSSDAQRQFLGSLHAHLPPMAAVHFYAESPGEDGSSKMKMDFVRAGYPTDVVDGPVD